MRYDDAAQLAPAAREASASRGEQLRELAARTWALVEAGHLAYDQAEEFIGSYALWLLGLDRARTA